MSPNSVAASKCPIHPLTAVVLLFADWAVYAVNTATYIQEFWLVDSVGAILACMLAGLSESYFRQAALQPALLRGLVVGAIVLVPLPALGTLVAALALLWHFFGFVSRRPKRS